MALSNAFPLIPYGIPKMPYRQIKRTATIRAILFFRFFFMVLNRSSKKPGGLALGVRRALLSGYRSNRAFGDLKLQVVGSCANDD